MGSVTTSTGKTKDQIDITIYYKTTTVADLKKLCIALCDGGVINL